MPYLSIQDHEIKSDVRSVDPAKVSAVNRIAYAAGATQYAFRGNYAPPSHASFVDKSPAEIAVIRAAMWGRAK